MPVYQVTTAADLLSDEQRQQIATEVTRIHTSHTGAPELFVNVVFSEVPAGRTFTAGERSQMSFIVGQIREGREIEVRQAMLAELSAMWIEVTGHGDRDLLLAIQENDSRAAMEAGLIFPAPGTEAEWFTENKDKLVALGLVEA
jgi:phenylpyruvate tautomerase PptA (4-oxalocrotonate tautomerase family)